MNCHSRLSLRHPCVPDSPPHGRKAFCSPPFGGRQALAGAAALFLIAATNGRAGITTSGNVTGTGTPYAGADPWTTASLAVGNTAPGTLTIDGGSVVNNANLNVAFKAGASTSTFTLRGAGSQFNDSISMNIGGGGTGILNITDGGAAVCSAANLGGSGGNGTANVGGGAGTSSWNIANGLTVGVGGGTLIVTGGGSVSDASAMIGFVGPGAVTVGGGTGASIWTTTGSMSVGGFGGFATININKGGTISTGTMTGSPGIGTMTFDGGTLRVTGTSTTSATTPMTFLAGGATFDTPNAGTNLVLSNGAIGAGSVTKTGQAMLSLGNNNSYTGTTTISDGSLSAGVLAVTGGVSSMGNSATPVVLGDGTHVGTINYVGSAATYTRGFIVTPGGGGGALISGVALQLTGGGIVIGAGATMTLSNATVSNTCLISGPQGNVAVRGVTNTFSGANTYTGSTTVTTGTLKAGIASVAGVSGAFGIDSAIITANTSGVKLDVTGFDTRVGSLAGGGTTGGGVTLGAAALTIAGANASTADFAGVISGTNGSLIKLGAGTQSLSAANTYTGTTSVNGGILSVNNTTGSGTGTGNVAVNSAGTLGGGGKITGSVTINSGGHLAPGNSIGTLSTGALSLIGTSDYQVEINTTTRQSDLVSVTGNLTIALGSTVTLSLKDLGADADVPTGNVFSLFTYTGSWNGGTFVGLADDSTFLFGSNVYRISYNGVNNLTKTVTLEDVGYVPEAGSTGALFGLAGVGLALARRRRRQPARSA